MRTCVARLVVVSVPIGWALACGSSSTPTPITETDAAVTVDASDAHSDDVAVDTGEPEAKCVLTRKLGSPLCEKCLRARCCTPILACEADVACATVLGCSMECIVNSSNPTTCIERCVQATPAGEAKYKAFDDCIAAPPDPPAPGCAFDCSQ